MPADHLTWRQLNVRFTVWADAETTVARRLAPVLEGTAASWWFIRKQPCWRIRATTIADELRDALESLRAEGHVAGHHEVIYEPETAAFGGPAAMELAHALFHADSRALLTTDRRSSPLGRPELSVLLCSTLLRAARLEWYEMGDVWHRVAAERPLAPSDGPDAIAPTAGSIRHLLRADTAATGGIWGDDGPGRSASNWAEHFRRTGEALGQAAHTGTLTRGIRAVLAYHVIFHWNRLGLPARAQSMLAHAATTAVLHQPDSGRRPEG
ncbi:thiopeptide-type bacteriocin biosynthesis protein [Streptomyces harbinensis]|uniref:thiopeptide-type bacteriocin biosynthesis protein n=1 Tax=Streptomyces harbinensis TaxID=1176198 RepID=UPI003712C72E